MHLSFLDLRNDDLSLLVLASTKKHEKYALLLDTSLLSYF